MTEPVLIDREEAAKVARVLLPELKQERTSALCKAVTHKAILSRAEESIKQLLAALPPYTTAPAPLDFQPRVLAWLLERFGAEIANDKEERNHRFLEESLELVQACGCTQSEAHQLVDYVFGRPSDPPQREVGGVMLTLAALCCAQGFSMEWCAEAELQRVWGKIETIRAKQAAKPKHEKLMMLSGTLLKAAAAIRNGSTDKEQIDDIS